MTFKLNIKTGLSIAGFALFVVGMMALVPAKSYALPSGYFNAGDIISEGAFTDDDSMTPSEIQTFLNSQNSDCDTNGTVAETYYVNDSTGEAQTYSFSGATEVNGTEASYGQAYASYWNNHTTDPQGNTRPSDYVDNESVKPYVCLPNYVENPSTGQNNLQNPGESISGGESAAQIIFNAAQAYDINPQVLIVTLQKEQGLVTDSWPWEDEYTEAMGFNCPDTANGAACSGYSGFYNQVSAAAAQYRNYLNNPDNYNYVVGNNTIDYAPTAHCSQSSTVDIQDQATAALYDYTPYQPDANVIAATNMPGSSSGPGETISDNCAAYGNRNFWWYFSTWFGGYVSAVPNAVWRLYDPVNNDHLLSASVNEVNAYIASGWTDDGIVMYDDNQSGGIPIYRLWSASTKKHFYTSSNTEMQAYLNAGWTSDGVIFTEPPSGQPVWRLYNPITGDHFVTANPSDVSAYIASGYTNNGVVFYEPSNYVDPVYRLWSPINNDHLLTSSLNELTAYLDAGWEDDGVVFQSDPSGIPIYRLWSASTKKHFYTSSSTEMQAYLNAGWTSDGVIFNALQNGGTPVYRLYNPKTGDHVLTSSSAEVTNYENAGYSNDGIIFYTDNMVAARRIYNPTTGAHRTISNINTLWNMASQGWEDDGVQFYVSTTNGSPVYELYNSGSGSYFYTASTSEMTSYLNAGWTSDGVAFYAPSGATLPVYRLYNPANSTHMLTSSNAEVTAYENDGWTSDGVIFEADSTPQ